MENNFQNQYPILKKKINEKLKSYFDREMEKVKGIDGFSTDLIKSLSDYTLRGGKRLRAILVLYGYELIKGNIDEKVIDISIFTELIQSGLLIHDDVMDESDLRRGEKTIHRQFEDYLEKKNIKFGQSIAILVGNLAYVSTYDILTNSDFDNDTKNEALKVFNKYFRYVNYGQVKDVVLPEKDKYELSDIEFVNEYKTASYTLQMPLLVGATLANATEGQKDVLVRFGKLAGEAFQIKDDLLDIFSSSEEIGKDIFTDIKEGKKNFVYYKTMENCSLEEKEFIQNITGNRKNKIDDLVRYREIVELSGSKKECEDRINDLKKESIEVLDNSNLNELTIKKLKEIANFVISRLN